MLTNFSKLSSTKFHKNLFSDSNCYMQTAEERDIAKLRDMVLQLFIANASKKGYWFCWDYMEFQYDACVIVSIPQAVLWKPLPSTDDAAFVRFSFF